MVVNDGTVNSTADEVTITVNQVSNTNTAPVANAGTNQTVDANQVVTLDGSASNDADGDDLTYLWTAPNGIVLSDNTAVNPTFMASEYTTTTDLVFSLVVNDGAVNSTADEVTITVNQVSNTNTVPVANAGPDQTVDANETVTLDGSASNDADGDDLTYLWTAPNGIVLSDNTAVNPTFTAPEYNTNTDLSFSLVVNDGTVNSTADEVTITVNQVSNTNTAPVANAGTNQTVNANQVVTLDGSASNDADGDTLSYLWTAPTGIVLSDNTSVNPTFTAPELTTATDLVFSFVVNDGMVNSIADEATITVNQVSNTNTAPVANAGPDRTVDANETVTLDGSASNDADGDTLSYLWTAPNGIVLSDNTGVNPTFTADAEYDTNTDLSFSLVVNDGEVDSNADDVVVTVMASTTLNCSSLELETLITNESCSGEADGFITLVATGGVAPYEYRIGESIVSTEVAGLAAGDYVVSVTDANDCTLAIDVAITTSPELSVTTSVEPQDKLVTIHLNGSGTYYITLNENTIETTDVTVVLPLSLVNNTLRVTTDNECQGVFEDTIVLESDILIYPNPITDGKFSVRNISAVNEPMRVEFFTTGGKLLFQKLYQDEIAVYQDYIGEIPPGIYIVKISTLEEDFYEKVIVN